jgi:hypothetical protein
MHNGVMFFFQYSKHDTFNIEYADTCCSSSRPSYANTSYVRQPISNLVSSRFIT